MGECTKRQGKCKSTQGKIEGIQHCVDGDVAFSKVDRFIERTTLLLVKTQQLSQVPVPLVIVQQCPSRVHCISDLTICP